MYGLLSFVHRHNYLNLYCFLTGVKARARCCRMPYVSCDYVTAGPSLMFDGARAEARCPAGKLALGQFNHLKENVCIQFYK